MKFIRKYILSYDTILALLLSGFCIYFLPNWVGSVLIKDLLGMGIGVLSIIFSIFFAALAFIISASDDDFVAFLEEDGLFTELIDSFKWTVISLFVALIYSIIIYVISSFNESKKAGFEMSEYVMSVFCFLFFYSLIATIISTNDAIQYSKSRITYVKLKKKNEEEAP